MCAAMLSKFFYINRSVFCGYCSACQGFRSHIFKCLVLSLEEWMGRRRWLGGHLTVPIHSPRESARGLGSPRWALGQGHTDLWEGDDGTLAGHRLSPCWLLQYQRCCPFCICPEQLQRCNQRVPKVSFSASVSLLWLGRSLAVEC